jgi:hypothetical protein
LKGEAASGVRDMKAQVSVDFIIASIVVISLFLVLFTVYSGKNQAIRTAMANLESQRIGESIAYAINEVSRGGSGAKQTLTVPSDIRGEKYSLEIRERWVEITWQHGGEDHHLSVPLMTDRTKAGSLQPGSVITIQNKGGTVDIS